MASIIVYYYQWAGEYDLSTFSLVDSISIMAAVLEHILMVSISWETI
jgi:hypothetical protein